MANTIKLPPRSNAITFAEEFIKDILETLDDVPVGEAAIVGDAQETATKARDRSKRVKAILWEEHDLRVKAHAVETDDGFIPAVSIPVKDQ